jgi:PAS domain S-box-containing protein
LAGQGRNDRDLTAVRAMLENAERLAHMGSWEFRPDQESWIWSDNMFRILGLEPQSFVPDRDSLYGYIHPDDLAEFRDEVHRIAASGTPRPPFEYRLIRPDGGVRYMRASTAMVDSTPGGRRIVGSVEDRSEQRRSEREIAAHVAVANALADWDGLESGGERLLRSFAQAMGFDRATMWTPAGDALEPRLYWNRFGEDLEAELADLHIPRGVGLSGSAWARREPISVSDVGEELAYSFRQAAIEQGLRGALAFPAVHGDEVLAVLGFGSRDAIEMTDRLTDCLRSIGIEIGSFLSRRRGELSPALLSKRELEVLQLAAQGNPGPQIAERLHITLATVRTHFERIYAKLEVSDRGTAVATALRLGLIE